MNPTEPLLAFSLPVRTWFQETFGEPTPPQTAGWPPIQRGEHTLILAPTGSGKTLAAFLWAIDEIYNEIGRADAVGQKPPPGSAGVRLLYVSPLKALNNDIERNLRAPLAGIRAAAERLGTPLRPLRVALRTGDTSASARASMVRQPPDILITTPESLYLMLTSPRAREMFRATRTVIVDEIHTMCGEKRGAHLALTLERLGQIAADRVQRIGLSATIRPLEEAARFLGGQEWEALDRREGEALDRREGEALDRREGEALDRREGVERAAVTDQRPGESGQHTEAGGDLIPRAVTIVDTGYRKPLELEVVTPVEDFRNLPGGTVWPAVIPQVLRDVMRHRTTLIFCNNRRLAERTADRLNAQIAAEQSEEIPPGSTEALAPGGVARDRGMFAIGAEGPIRAHHGSMSREARHRMEEDLKAGRLPALVGTSSLELGIDIGAIDLVVQLQSPKSVAQGLQRVGRSGHLVGQTSRGRIYATFREDVVEAAAVARGMLEADVEPTATPQNPLDVLAQQIVAMVSVESWSVPTLYRLVRQAYPYRDLSLAAFLSVLEMLAGKYYGRGGPTHDSLRARVAWDRTNDRLAALPGTRLLALSNPGTIPDTGAFDVYLADNTTKIGTLDEEFVFETRVGDVFLLGSSTWRVLEIGDDRIVAGGAAGSIPRMPFWHGDYPWRPFELGVRIGRLRREVAERLRQACAGPEAEGGARSWEIGEGQATPGDGSPPGAPAVLTWLKAEYALDDRSARNLVDYVQRQIDINGVLATDDTIVVESFADAVGDPRVVVHSPFGGRVNGAWALAIGEALREHTGVVAETQTSDDGILFRLPQGVSLPVAEIIRRMSPDEARERILRGLPDSPVFGAHFRMNAARALLLPRARGRRRTPFWLQRLKARDLLAIVRGFGDFPLVVETYRDCLQDIFDLPHLEQLVGGIQRGEIRLVSSETAVPSPVAAGLLFNFISVYMYEWDTPKAERQLGEISLRRELLEDLVQGAASGEVAAPAASQEVLARAGRLAPGYGARSVEELAVIFEELGDLDSGEVEARCSATQAPRIDTVYFPVPWLAELALSGRVVEVGIPAGSGPERRWVPVDLLDEYRAAFPGLQENARHVDRASGAAVNTPGLPLAAESVLRRFLRWAGPVTRAAILARYAFDPAQLDDFLNRLAASREVVRGRFSPLPARADLDSRIVSDGEPLLEPADRVTGQENEYCDSHLLEQIQRRTLAVLREQVRPVSYAAFADFMLRWQGLAEPRREAGIDTLREVMNQLQGAWLPGLAWEREVLPARLRGYRPGDLEMLFESGELVWALSGRDPGRARACFFARGQGALFLQPADRSSLGEAAGLILAFLEAEGASLLADLEVGLHMPRAALQAGLAELCLAGWVTNDTTDALDAILHYQPEGAVGREAPSTVESELAFRLGPRPLGRRPSRERYQAARKAAERRLRTRLTAEGWRGRWFLLHRASIMGTLRGEEDRGDALSRVLLARYGILCREIVEREGGPADWASLSIPLARMELRGEIRRGYFVAGLSGIQYALPEAVEMLRSRVPEPLAAAGDTNARSLPAAPGRDRPLILVNATDPANLYGGEAAASVSADDRPALRFARVPSTHLLLIEGEPVLVAEDGGERMTAGAELEPDTIRRMVSAYLQRPNAPRHVVVRQWNSEALLGSSAEEVLHSVGFSRTPDGMEWWSGRPT